MKVTEQRGAVVTEYVLVAAAVAVLLAVAMNGLFGAIRADVQRRDVAAPFDWQNGHALVSDP